jgi:BirA family biotin operon repressor/biotin-[acetyl-CoA-carboxylase] ligase
MLAGDFAPWDVVCTDVQTAGRGRSGRTWQAAPGDGLLFTVQLPLMPPELLPGAQIVAGYACCNALMPYVDVRLKWPNDLTLHGAKLGGLLIETRFMGSNLHKVVLGIGINIKNAPEQENAAFLEAEGQSVSHDKLLVLILDELKDVFEDYLAGNLSISEEWQHYSAFYQKSISVHVDGVKTELIEKGITAEGFLIAEKDGKEKIIKAL